MRIIARGWGRNQGETEIMNVALGDAVDPPAPGDYYSSGQAYLEVEHPYLRKRTTAKVSAGTEQLRLGGRYLLKIELSATKSLSCSMPLTAAISCGLSDSSSKMKKDKRKKKNNDKKPLAWQPAFSIISTFEPRGKSENC
jgi:hypothetical protein